MINKINISNSGYVFCRSNFYTAQDVLNDTVHFEFTPGVNMASGEIDSGIWAVSYLMSMYTHRPDDFILFEDAVADVDGKTVSLSELSELSCYIDKVYPLFSTDLSVRELVNKGLKENKLDCSANDIKDLFYLDHERFERPLSCVGNEVFRAMAAVGYCNKKEIYCFPWFSKRRFDGYHANMTGLLEILESLNKVVIVPVGLPDGNSSSYFRKMSTIERDENGLPYFQKGD